MATTNTQITSEIKAALNAHIEHMVALAKESSTNSIFNIENVPELGNVLQQAEKQKKYLESLKDAQALYDIVHDVFTKHDVENYQETEVYEEKVCDIRSDAEYELRDKIDDEISSFLSKVK